MGKLINEFKLKEENKGEPEGKVMTAIHGALLTKFKENLRVF
jgi:hypothetical protein